MALLKGLAFTGLTSPNPTSLGMIIGIHGQEFFGPVCGMTFALAATFPYPGPSTTLRRLRRTVVQFFEIHHGLGGAV